MINNNPNTDRFDGDTLIIIGPNGADYDVQGGDPVRGQGFINHINIAQLTEPGWCGNELEDVASRKIGSKYLPLTKNALTKQLLLDLNKAAEADVKGPEFGDQRAITTIEDTGIKTTTFVQPPTGDIQVLQTLKSGKSWINQFLNPIPERAK